MRASIVIVGLVLALLAVSFGCEARPPAYDYVVEPAQITDGLGWVKRVVSDALNGANNYLEQTMAYVGDSVVLGMDLAKDPDEKRNVSEIISSRGFDVEEHQVVTKDGYILTIHRIINPLIDKEHRPKLKPVIMQHGLMSSSVDWVINSVTVRPINPFGPKDSSLAEDLDSYSWDDGERVHSVRADRSTAHQFDSSDSPLRPNSLGFFMANEGYDVFLANSRGNIYGQRHLKLSSWEPKFWSFSFDEQIKYDLPDTIEYVQKLTNHTKVGYVGHSQGTLMMFGLLSDRPEYADIVEPVIALAPVAYCDNNISPVKYAAVYTPLFQNINWWFATSNAILRHLYPIVCTPKVIRKDICGNILFLSVGFDEDELDDSRISAYLSHMPSGTSIKNIAHYGQMVLSRQFAKYDHGVIGNQIKYGQPKPPNYRLQKIRSKSLVLFTAENDWLAAPKDVARLKHDLMVKPYAVFNMTKDIPKFNHIDYVYGKHAGELVNTKIIKIFKDFDKAEQQSRQRRGERALN